MMNISFEIVLLLIFVFICGNMAGRIDTLAQSIHKDCNYTLTVYYYALSGACFALNKDQHVELSKQFIKSATEIIKEETKNVK